MNQTKPIGIDVTRQIEKHMETYPLPPGFQRHLATVPEAERQYTLWLAKFVPCAVEVAVPLRDRGFILANRIGPLQVWFVKRSDLDKAVTRATPETLNTIRKMMDTYNPNREGVIVIMTMDYIQPIYLNAQGRVQGPPQPFARTPLNKQELVFRPGVTSKREQTLTGITYSFSHETLGALGSVSLDGFGVQSKMQVNVAKGDPNNPSEPQRLELFQSLVTELDQKFHATLGLSMPDQAWLNDITAMMPTYQVFLSANTSLELDKLIRSLTPEQLQNLIRFAEKSMALSSPHDAEAVRQRLADVERLLAMPQTFTESLIGLSNFVEAKTEEEARQIILAQPNLLLSDAAEQEWSELLAPDDATQAHIDNRKRLWQEIRDLHTQQKGE